MAEKIKKKIDIPNINLNIVKCIVTTYRLKKKLFSIQVSANPYDRKSTLDLI